MRFSFRPSSYLDAVPSEVARAYLAQFLLKRLGLSALRPTNGLSVPWNPSLLPGQGSGVYWWDLGPLVRPGVPGHASVISQGVFASHFAIQAS